MRRSLASLGLCGGLFAGALIPLLRQQPVVAAPNPATPAKSTSAPSFKTRTDMPPRKVIIGTAVQGFWEEYPGIEKRLELLRGIVDEMGAQATKKYPGRGLDLVVIPENAVTSGRARKAADRAVPFTGIVRDTFVELAKRYKTYVVVTLDLAEGSGSKTYSNAAILLDRTGKQVGIYRKVHPVAVINQDELEGGITPGREFPVFDCDFGKLGIQICYDMVYDDGWAEQARKGAEVVVWPSASPAKMQAALRARQNGYYLISSTFRDNSTFFEPTGMVAAQVRTPDRVVVQEIDLSYALLPWSGKLENGQAFREKYGDRAGFNYYPVEDIGIFWSNDPATPISQMVRELGLVEVGPDIERNRQIQDAARGGPASR